MSSSDEAALQRKRQRLDERQSVDGSSTRRDPISPQARAMYIGNNLAGQNNYGSLSPGGAASSGLGTSSYRVSPDPEPSTKAQRNRPNSTKRRRKSGHQRISGAPASNVSLKPLRPISSAQPSPYSSIQPSLGGASIGAQKKEQRIARGDEYLYHGPTDLPPRSSSTNPLGGVGPSGSSASAAREYTDEEIDRIPQLARRVEKLERHVDTYVKRRGERALERSIVPGMPPSSQQRNDERR